LKILKTLPLFHTNRYKGIRGPPLPPPPFFFFFPFLADFLLFLRNQLLLFFLLFFPFRGRIPPFPPPSLGGRESFPPPFSSGFFVFVVCALNFFPPMPRFKIPVSFFSAPPLSYQKRTRKPPNLGRRFCFDLPQRGERFPLLTGEIRARSFSLVPPRWVHRSGNGWDPFFSMASYLPLFFFFRKFFPFVFWAKWCFLSFFFFFFFSVFLFALATKTRRSPHKAIALFLNKSWFPPNFHRGVFSPQKASLFFLPKPTPSITALQFGAPPLAKQFLFRCFSDGRGHKCGLWPIFI